LPVELWHHVISQLWDREEDLKTCALVCAAWTERSRCLLLKRAHLYSKSQVIRLAQIVRSDRRPAETVQAITIGGGRQHTREPIRHVKTAFLMLAGVLPRMTELRICNALWAGIDAHPQAFLHLSSFSAITSLILDNIEFQSMRVFARLVDALSGLEQVQCGEIAFTMQASSSEFMSDRRQRLGRNMRRLDIDESAADIVRFYVTTQIAARLQEIRLGFRTPIHLADLEDVQVQELLQSAASTLSILSISLVSAKIEADVTTKPFSSHLDLTANTTLRELHLEVRPRWEYSLAWLHTLLSSTASPLLQRITIRFTARHKHDRDIIDVILNKVDAQQCTALDKLLSPPRFAAVRSFECVVAVAQYDPIPAQKQWQRRLEQRFPGLHERGVLR
ncbi:hypothetical protein WOLCODRAFT_83109, partial [Wolfiporia cocos MD-104 SS10]